MSIAAEKYGQLLDTLPPLIRQMTSQEMWDTDETGLSQAAVFCGKKMVLKIEKENSTADQEYHMLSWLQGKLPVPRLLAFERKDGRNYLLMERLSGEMACADSYMEDPARQAEVLANGLRLLWSTDISGCPYPDMTSRKLKLARERVEMGLVSMEDAEPETYGPGGFSNPHQLLFWLEEHQPKEHPVLSHGDFCLPNIFGRGSQVTGFLDLGHCGIADPYQDLALCFRSLKHNLEGNYGGPIRSNGNPRLLFEKLGIEPDWEKIRYYILLDELF